MAKAKADHVAVAALLDHAEGRRPAAAVVSHLRDCASCTESLAEITAIRASVRASHTLIDPPEAAMRSALDLFPRRPSLIERAAMRVREVFLLAGDTMLAPSCGKLAFAGVRGHVDPAHYRFRGEGVEVDLELGGSQVTGQIVAANATPSAAVTAWIERGGERGGIVAGSEAPVGRDGMFRIELIPPASTPFDVVIDCGEERLRVHVAPRVA